jgi:hypothetical protein
MSKYFNMYQIVLIYVRYFEINLLKLKELYITCINIFSVMPLKILKIK